MSRFEDFLQKVFFFRKYEGYPFVGIYRTMSPCLLIREPELIKNIVVKDFNHFVDNDVPMDKKVDPIFGRNPFVLRGTEWKTKRQQLTSHFTPGKVTIFFFECCILYLFTGILNLCLRIRRSETIKIESKIGVKFPEYFFCHQRNCFYGDNKKVGKHNLREGRAFPVIKIVEGQKTMNIGKYELHAHVLSQRKLIHANCGL